MFEERFLQLPDSAADEKFQMFIKVKKYFISKHIKMPILSLTSIENFFQAFLLKCTLKRILKTHCVLTRPGPADWLSEGRGFGREGVTARPSVTTGTESAFRQFSPLRLHVPL